MKFVGEDGKEIEMTCLMTLVRNSNGNDNLDQSIIDFARASMNYGLKMNWDVYLSKKTQL